MVIEIGQSLIYNAKISYCLICMYMLQCPGCHSNTLLKVINILSPADKNYSFGFLEFKNLLIDVCHINFFLPVFSFIF